MGAGSLQLYGFPIAMGMCSPQLLALPPSPATEVHQMISLGAGA